MIIGKTFKFEAAHCLPGHEKCGRVHGHTYKLTVEIEGLPDSVTGFVQDFHEVGEIVERKILSVIDHRNLNDTLTILPTCENLATLIWVLLKREIPGLYSVTLQEGEGGYAREEG